MLTFVATLESFAVPQVLGTPAGSSTLTTRIYADLSLGSDPASFVDAVTLALGLVVIAAVVLLPADVLLGPKLRTVRTAQPVGSTPGSDAPGEPARPALALPVTCCLSLWCRRWRWCGCVDARHRRAADAVQLDAGKLPDRAGRPRSRRSGTVSNWRLAARILTVLGALLCALERRRAGRALGTVAILTFAIPGSTLAVGLLIAYGRWFDSGLA